MTKLRQKKPSIIPRIVRYWNRSRQRTCAAASESFSSSRAPLDAMYSRSAAFACRCSPGSR
ncbi:hypothetical protein PWY36_27720 [Kribbella solani]|nr:hypothetical protein [Kribbella solani]